MRYRHFLGVKCVSPNLPFFEIEVTDLSGSLAKASHIVLTGWRGGGQGHTATRVRSWSSSACFGEGGSVLVTFGAFGGFLLFAYSIWFEWG
jgi:hypothetical protein